MTARGFIAVAALIVASAHLVGAAPAARAQATSPTVVELFTSQGCDSCPPADAFLGELSRRQDVLALGFHIDYWDFLGWKDTFATKETTERQRAYGRSLGRGYIYTPQMVIGGVAQAVGSKRAKVEREIDKARARGVASVPVEVAVRDDGQVIVHVGAGEPAKKAAVWLVRYDREQAVEIARGENAGNMLTYYNVVRDITRIGAWGGEAIEIRLTAAELSDGGFDSCAVLVQAEGQGAILGATRFTLRQRSN